MSWRLQSPDFGKTIIFRKIAKKKFPAKVNSQNEKIMQGVPINWTIFVNC